MRYVTYFFLKIIFVLFGILLSPLLYLFKKKSKVWNKNQDRPYDLRKPFWYIWGNMEDGIYFDPYVYLKLNKKFKRGAFRDFFEWNILRNPTHNFELFYGLDLKEIQDNNLNINHELIVYDGTYKEIYTLKLANGKSYKFISIEKYFGNKKLKFYYGYRVHEIRPIDQVPTTYISQEEKEKYKQEEYKYLTHRGYPRIRFGIALRLKTIK